MINFGNLTSAVQRQATKSACCKSSCHSTRLWPTSEKDSEYEEDTTRQMLTCTQHHRLQRKGKKRQSFSTPWFSLIKPKSRFDNVALPCSSRYKTQSGIFVYPAALGSRLLSFPRQERWLRKAGLGGRSWTGGGAELADEKEFCWCSSDKDSSWVSPTVSKLCKVSWDFFLQDTCLICKQGI